VTDAVPLCKDADLYASDAGLYGSEIERKLDFKDNSHFSKYFKRHVDQTPIGFKSDNN
jgi:AraC-like DNA-binding protein